MDRRRVLWLGLAAVVTLVVFFLVGWPLAELVGVAAEQLEFGLPDMGLISRVVSNTLAVGVSVSLLTVTLGMGAAFLTERTSVIGRKWLRLGLLLPLLIPSFVSAQSWIRAYGPSGLTDDTLGLSMPGLFGPVGVILVISVNVAPLAYLMMVAALNSRVGRDFELAGRISGAGPATVARTVTIPLLAPALLGAGALTFVVGINAFGVPAFLGTPASFDTVTTRIYQDLALSARPESFSRAILLATGLVIIALVFVVIAEALLSGVGEGRPTGGPAGPADRLGRPRRVLTFVVWVLIILVAVFPLIALILVALTKGLGLPPTPGNLTFGNFREALEPRLLGALGRSLLLASVAATLAVLLGAAVAAFRRRRFGRFAGVAVLLSFAVPGSTLAVAMILSYGSLLRDTLVLILLAYLAKLWAVGHRSIAGSVGNIPRDLFLAARNSGASGFTALRTVIVPLLRPALFGAWVLVFLIGFHELTMSSLLYGPGTDTLAVAILNLQQLGDVPVSSALAVILTVPLLLVAIPLLVLGRLPRRLLGTR
ncbi:MAG: iron ABC transporter permease [Acidobacteria bacterium]|nr:iron ABC transporter permease [Acidobacteriota bacterium]